jgi:putative SOS response-associated peptidase YedK
VLSLVRWGLIPSWAKDMSGSAGMVNARSETASTKPAFRDPMKFRRCLVPADGFYEWARTGTAKQPYCFEVNDGELFAFAGLWDRWRDPSGQWIKSCSILTTTPNAVTSAVQTVCRLSLIKTTMISGSIQDLRMWLRRASC